MSLCQDKDFLIYRQRLVLFSQNATCQKFVSLPLSDDHSYISMSAEQAEVNLFQIKKKTTRLESLKDPFIHSSPLVESKLRRYAGNFESLNPLARKLSFSEPVLDAPTSPQKPNEVNKYGTMHQVLDMKMKRHSVDVTPSSARRDSIESESSDTKNYYFGKTASVAYVNFSDAGIEKQELTDIKEAEEEDGEEVHGNLSVGSKDSNLMDDGKFSTKV
jgi:hypothetical protein